MLTKKISPKSPGRQVFYLVLLSLAFTTVQIKPCNTGLSGRPQQTCQEREYAQPGEYDDLIELFKSIKDGDLENFKIILSRRPFFIDETWPIHFACRYGKLNIIKYLVEQYPGKEKIDTNKRINKCCIALNANAHIRAKGTNQIFIYGFGSIESKILDDAANFLIHLNNLAPIHVATMFGHQKIVKYLIEEKKANPRAKIQNNNYYENFAPIDLAFYFHHIEIIKYLTNNYGIKLNEINYKRIFKTFNSYFFQDHKFLEYILEKIKLENNGQLNLD
jgi:hypothetical protein